MLPIRFVVCSYNIWADTRWPEREPALRSFTELYRPDILCLQELRADSRRLLDEVLLSTHQRVEDPFPGWTCEGNIYWNTELFALVAYGAEPIEIVEEYRRLFWVRLRLRQASMARQLIEESLALSRELGDQYNVASALNMLGGISLLQEDVTTARMFQEESLRASQALGNQRGIAHSLSALGEIAYRRGDFAQACEHYEESLMILLRLDDRLMIAIYLEGLARAAKAQGEAIWAVYLLSSAQALRQSLGAAMTALERGEYEHICSRLHERLDKHTFATAWEKGHVLSPEQALAARHRFMQATALPLAEKLPVVMLQKNLSSSKMSDK